MSEAKRKQSLSTSLAQRYQETREYTKQLCSRLEVEDFVPQPIEDVSPAKWNIAHTTWFFEEMILKNHLQGYREFDPDFCFLFNSYYNTVGERTRRDKRGDLSRPTVKRVFEYRAHVDENLLALLNSTEDTTVFELVELGINHEQQHQELFLTDIKFVLSLNKIEAVFDRDLNLSNSTIEVASGNIEVEEGFFDIGHKSEDFCFDNELPPHKQFIQNSSLSSSLVTNKEYLQFIDDGGYSDHRLWHAEAWDWLATNEISCPMYWARSEDTWEVFTLAGRQLLNPKAPVTHVSFYEAAAFAEWSDKRLPTEFEWEAACHSFEWGARWEWTSSSYQSYPGFKVSEGAVGEYNGKFMVSQYVLRGASNATPVGHSRHTYRNFFHPHLRWQFTGIRLAERY